MARFQSTRPVRGATRDQEASPPSGGFNPRAPCGARHRLPSGERQNGGVSIHAPRAGRDSMHELSPSSVKGFNPRAPCGARPSIPFFSAASLAFQSTRPVRGATSSVFIVSAKYPSFNPRAPCGARRDLPIAAPFDNLVSIHAPHAGRDGLQAHSLVASSMFQSTRPMRGATLQLRPPHHHSRVSIHAPHAGRDRQSPIAADGRQVSIHAPHAGRDQRGMEESVIDITFQSTRPMRGATQYLEQQKLTKEFQSTRPMRGATTLLEGFKDNQGFQSTRPMRGATTNLTVSVPSMWFQSTRPMRGATPYVRRDRILHRVSIHAPHAGRDLVSFLPEPLHKVSIHAPHAGRDGKRSYDFPLLPHIYGYYSPQI